MNIFETRWWNANLFLSLDMIQPFQDGLWLDFYDLAGHQKLIRKTVLPLIEQDNHSIIDRNLCVVFVLEEILRDSVIIFKKFAWWVNNIFIFGGDDRINEMTWSSIILDIYYQKHLVKLPKTIIDNIERIVDDYLAISNSFEENIDAYNAVSDWDNFILRSQQLEIQDGLRIIKLILNYNAFINIWNKRFSDLNYQNLCELYRYGMQVAGKTMNSIDISFPGSWKYDLVSF